MFDRVMLVDDNDADLVYTEVVLCGRGVAREVISFDTAQAALDCLADPLRPAVSLILLDINKPEMDGFGFLAAYAQMHATLAKPAPVVMLTSSPEASDRERALAIPVVRDYLIKPLNDDAIRRLEALALSEPGASSGPAA
jgi:CheY-like chemotaxis protein